MIAWKRLLRIRAFSTFTQFGAVGTNQLEREALVNGASCGFFALIEARLVEFGICLPTVASFRIEALLVKILIQSYARALFLLVTGTATSEPPRNVGMYLPAMWLGIGYAPIFFASEGLPSFSSSAYGHSQPLPIIEPTRPFEKTSACCGFASSVVLLARERALTIDLTWFKPWSAWGELSVPFHLPFLNSAILPP